MFDFDHLTPDKTAKLKLPSMLRVPRTSPHPIELELKHAGDGNPAFVTARLKTPVPPDRVAQYERIAKLIADHVIAGWSGVLDGKCEHPVPYTKARGIEFLTALVRAKRFDVIDWIHAFAVDADNFHEPIVLAEELGKD